MLDGPVLLIDDECDSRWTLTVAAHLLGEAGAGPVLPLVLRSSVRRRLRSPRTGSTCQRPTRSRPVLMATISAATTTLTSPPITIGASSTIAPRIMRATDAMSAWMISSRRRTRRGLRRTAGGADDHGRRHLPACGPIQNRWWLHGTTHVSDTPSETGRLGVTDYQRLLRRPARRHPRHRVVDARPGRDQHAPRRPRRRRHQGRVAGRRLHPPDVVADHRGRVAPALAHQPGQAVDRARPQVARGHRDLQGAGRRTPTSWSRRCGPAHWSGSASATTSCARSTRRIVFCTISGYGATGPYKNLPSTASPTTRGPAS